MSEHIRFPEIEHEDSVDQNHLTQCERCSREWEIYRLVRLQTRSIPKFEVPASFAPHVVRLTRTLDVPWSLLLTLFARRLAPVFSALVLCLALLLFTTTEAEPKGNGYANLLFEETLQPTPEEISLDYVVNALREDSKEEDRDRSL